MCKNWTRVWVWFGSLAAAALMVPAAHAYKPALVPPTMEIEVLDPGVDPVGNPAIIPTPGPDGITRVNVPPTVLVHRYYYTGDRVFQGPLLRGGPCILVANHPKTGERVYVPAQMLPGAPRVIYKEHAIEYDYGRQGITLHFCFLTGTAKVVYRGGVPVARQVGNAASAVGTAGKNLVARTSLPECTANVAYGIQNVTLSLVDRTQDLADFVLTPVAQVVSLVPGINLLISSKDDLAERANEYKIKRADTRAKRQEMIYLPTNQ